MTNNHITYKKYYILFPIILAIAVRCFDFNMQTIVTRDSVNFVEQTCRFLNNPKSIIIEGNQEPVHIVALAGILKFFYPNIRMKHPYQHPEIWEKVLFIDGLIFSIINIILIFMLTNLLWTNPWCGLLSATLYAVHKEICIYSIWGLCEPIYITFILLSAYLIYITIQSNTIKATITYAILAGIVSFMMTMTRKEGLLIVSAILLFLIASSKVANKKQTIIGFISSLIVMLTSYLFLLNGRFPWYEFFWEKTIDWGRLHRWLNISDTVLAICKPSPICIFTGISLIYGLLIKGGYIPTPLVIGYLWSRKKLKPNLPDGLLWLIAIAQICAFQFYLIVRGWYVGRYLVPASIVLLPFSAVFLQYLLKSLPSIHLKKLMIASIIIAMTGQCVYRFVRKPRGYSREIRSTSNWLNKNTPQNAIIICDDCRVGFYSKRLYIPIYHNIVDNILQDKRYSIYYLTIIPEHEHSLAVITKLSNHPAITIRKIYQNPQKHPKIIVYKLKVNKNKSPKSLSKHMVFGNLINYGKTGRTTTVYYWAPGLGNESQIYSRYPYRVLITGHFRL